MFILWRKATTTNNLLCPSVRLVFYVRLYARREVSSLLAPIAFGAFAAYCVLNVFLWFLVKKKSRYRVFQIMVSHNQKQINQSNPNIDGKTIG